MRRINKSCVSKEAFTLLEIVLVVAIIVILASALLTGVKGYIDQTNTAKNKIDESAQAVDNQVHASEVLLSNYGF
jgi:prepilin-type N-terminal cleavage/methylation domain-containing protein